MLVIGANGVAKKLLQVFYQLGKLENLVFFDDVTENMPEKFYDRFRILKKIDQARDLFINGDNRFVLGVGNPKIRLRLSQKFIGIGGSLTTLISPKADIGFLNTCIGAGSTIMTGAVIENGAVIGEGCLINLNCTISHDSRIGRYTELSPGVHVLGSCQIGDYCSIGAGCVILPKLTIGNNAVIGAGAVVTKSVQDGQTVVGVPAKPI